MRGDPSAYKPGVTQQFFVIDNNSGETWPITVIGDEQVQTQAGIIGARHFMRLPRRDGDTRRIDMWLAPSLGWLPARLVQTEPNGAQIELLWHGRLAAPSAPADEAPAGGATPAPAGTPTPDASTAPATEPAQPAPPATCNRRHNRLHRPRPRLVTSPVHSELARAHAIRQFRPITDVKWPMTLFNNLFQSTGRQWKRFDIGFQPIHPMQRNGVQRKPLETGKARPT